MFRVPSSEFVFRVGGTVNLERRTVNQNAEHEPGTRNREPGTALLHRGQLMPQLVLLGLEIATRMVAGGNLERNGLGHG